MSLPIATINMKYLKHNIDYLQSISDGAELYPVIKANAYSLGAEKIYSTLIDAGCKRFWVATIEEAREMLKTPLKETDHV